MNRAMFSGVAGLKAHQTKMDVIGNNIANVNTYGFKSQRAVFSDIYYQTVKSASGGTTNRGGSNPSSVGYGSALAAIQTQMSQSSMQNTGFGMDVAIMGEGFLQVMDPAGNIFYTKAGMLDYDSNGYLTDINGNFVLGAASADGKPGSQKIRLDNIGSVEAKKPTVTVPINGVEYTLTASNATKYGNVTISIGASENLPAGVKAQAGISNNGAIAVQLNAYEKFNSIAELNTALNDAIREANNGKEHAAGTFTLTASENKFGKDSTPGTWTGYATNQGTTLKPTNPAGLFDGSLKIKDFDLAAFPAADGPTGMTLTKHISAATPPVIDYTLSVVVGGKTYEGKFDGKIAQNAPITLTDTTAGSTKKITLEVGDRNKLTAVLGNLVVDGATTTDQVQQTKPQYFLGGSEITAVSGNFSGKDGVTFSYAVDAVDPNLYKITAKIGGKDYAGTVPIIAGGTVTLKTADEALDGTISVKVPSKADMLKNYGIDPAAANADTLLKTEMDASLDFQSYQMKPYDAGIVTSLTGAEIAGTNFGVNSGTITGMDDGAFGGGMKFQKTSTSFHGSGKVTGADFQAAYKETTPPSWEVTMTVGGVAYTGSISKDTVATSMLLKGPAGDYIQVSNPGFDAMNTQFQALYPTDTIDGNSTMAGLTGGVSLTVNPATASKDLGFGSSSFSLSGGSEGGAITLDQLASISIGADGSISVSHPEKGTVVAGKVSLATFANPSGLQLNGQNYYSETANSGDPKLCDPGSSGAGGLKSSALEMSNVDLSGEFADMITTQRGFQANSRIITVSDSMLEELINLKR